MDASRDLQAVGDRVEGLLAELRSLTDPAVTDKVEEVVRLLVELYGATVEHMLEVVAEEPDGRGIIDRLAGDPLVASVMILHDLHPLTTEQRVHQALESVRPYLGSHAGGVEFLGVDEAGVAQLKLEGSCSGCASSTVTVKLAIEQAINDAAPELAGIHVEGVAEPAPALLQIRTRRHEPEPDSGDGAWVVLDGVAGLGPGELRAVEADGVRVLVCSTGADLLAYVDACGRCGSYLEHGRLDGSRLTCPACDAAWDVRLAGRGLDGLDAHLDPLPLLREGDKVKVAPPSRVPT